MIAGLVDRHVQCLANPLVVERLLLDVEGEVADIEAFLLLDLQLRISLQLRQIGRIWVAARSGIRRPAIWQFAPSHPE